MNKFTNLLDNVKIASPCSQDWNEMLGTDRKRFCGDCKLNVYNLSGMTTEAAESLLINSEGRLCVRFYRRADGSILTKDCPVGWARVKRRVSKTAAFASLGFGLLTSLGFVSLFSPQKQMVGEVGSYRSAVNAALPVSTPEEYPMMGNISITNQKQKLRRSNPKFGKRASR